MLEPRASRVGMKYRAAHMPQPERGVSPPLGLRVGCNPCSYGVVANMPSVASEDVGAHGVQRVEVSAGIELDDVPAREDVVVLVEATLLAHPPVADLLTGF